MAEAVVGDDVFGDDPDRASARGAASRSWRARRRRCSCRAARWATSSRSRAQTRAGRRGAARALTRTSFINEQGGIAANSGCLAHPVRERPRRASPIDDVRGAFRVEDEHVARAHARVPREHAQPRTAARSCRSSTAARDRAPRTSAARASISTARGCGTRSARPAIPIREWARDVDTLMMCFSKGLGAPVGSILVGPSRHDPRARRIRKRWGGGMRQVGHAGGGVPVRARPPRRPPRRRPRAARAVSPRVCAAPGVSRARARDQHRDDRSRAPARSSATPCVRRLERARRAACGPSARGGCARSPHLDVDDAGVERAIAAFHDVVRDLTPAAV